MIGQDDNKVVFNGNGIATQFPYSFKILNETDLKLIYIDKKGNETILSSDYYVNMEQSYVTYPGYAPGTEPPEIDRPPVLANGEKLIVYREVPITQNSEFGDRWPFNEVEKGLDKLTIIAQQLAESESRSIKVGMAEDNNVEVIIPVEAGKSLRWNEDGTKLEVTEDPAIVLVKTNEALEEALTLKEQSAEIKDYVEVLSTNVNVFIPSVDVDGNLSWNNKAGITNPASRNIMGPQGPRGERGLQGERGVSGVYVGSGDMPEGYNVQIDVTGESLEYPTKTEVQDMIAEQNYETWTFTLEDGSTIEKKVLVK